MAAASNVDKRSVRGAWQRIYNAAVEADSWGQALEAQEEYEKLTTILDHQVPLLPLSSDERTFVLKFRHSLTLRRNVLAVSTSLVIGGSSAASSSSNSQRLELDHMKRIQRALDDLFSRPVEFPVALTEYVAVLETRTLPEGEIAVIEEHNTADGPPVEIQQADALLPAPVVKAGMTTIIMFIDKIGLKDADTYIAPRITLLVTSPTGPPLESQTTPSPTHPPRPQYLTWQLPIYVQTSLEAIEQANASIFLEFKHWKAKKKKLSTRCFALMEPAELRRANDAGQPICLELYQKPTEWSKRGLKLFSVKKLYLHVQVTLDRH